MPMPMAVPVPGALSAARPGSTWGPCSRRHEAQPGERPAGGAGRGGPGARSRCQPPAAPQVPALRSHAGRERGRGRGAALARGPGEPPARCGAARPQEAPISAGQWRRRAVTGQIWPPLPAGTKGTGHGGETPKGLGGPRGPARHGAAPHLPGRGPPRRYLPGGAGAAP